VLPPTFSIASFAVDEKACAVILTFAVKVPRPNIFTKSFFDAKPFLTKVS